MNPVQEAVAEVEMSDSLQQKTDGRKILSVSNCIQMGLINVYIRTKDANVAVLHIAFMPDILKINAGAQVITICGVGTHKCYMLINEIAESMT